jgi:hypothetical protein
MTGNELRERREALGLSAVDLGDALDTDLIELWESFDEVPSSRILELALDQIEDQQSTAEHDALMARVAAATARTEQILRGRRIDPPAADQALILAAQQAVQVIGKSIEIMRHKGELPQTLKALQESHEVLNKAIEGALGI